MTKPFKDGWTVSVSIERVYYTVENGHTCIEDGDIYDSLYTSNPFSSEEAARRMASELLAVIESDGLEPSDWPPNDEEDAEVENEEK